MSETLSTRRGKDTPLPNRSTIPAIRIDDNRYQVLFAATHEELDAALHLRFRVFNLELGEGLDTSLETGRDRDPFDVYCHHLLVIRKDTREVIGTYRMQTSEMANFGKGFYSADEFDFRRLPAKILLDGVEVGRACISHEHRNGRVLFLLWKGLARYMVEMQKRFLFGCCSLTSQDPVEARQVMDYLVKSGNVWDGELIPPTPAFQCYEPEFNAPGNVKVQLPRLFRTYLQYGAKVYSLPATDRQFKTIDYLVVLDIESLDDRTRVIFFSDTPGRGDV